MADDELSPEDEKLANAIHDMAENMAPRLAAVCEKHGHHVRRSHVMREACAIWREGLAKHDLMIVTRRPHTGQEIADMENRDARQNPRVPG